MLARTREGVAGPEGKWRSTRLLILCLLVIMLAPSVPPVFVRANPGTLHVPSTQYPTIQSAVTAAVSGDSIIVASGTYAENVLIDKSLTLTGAGNSSTFLDGQGIGPGVTVFTTSGVAISGFTIRNPGIFNSSVLVISSFQVKVSQSVLVGSSKQSNGTTIYDSYAVTVASTVETGNLYGVAVQGGFANVIQEDNASGNVIGVGIFNSTGNVVKLNTLRYGSEGVRIWYPGATGNLVTRNLIANNSAAGISMLSSSGNRIIGNEVDFNNLLSTTEGIYLSSSTGNRIYYNNIRNNTLQVYAVYAGDMTGSVWNDSGTRPKGNFWSDYNGTDADNDGIGDTNRPWPCFRASSVCSATRVTGVDQSPLMKPWTFSSLIITAAGQPVIGCPSVLNVTFTGSAQKGAPPYAYDWDFADGSRSAGQSVSHVYSAKGTFFATLTVIDSSATNGTDIVPIIVFAGGLFLTVTNGQASLSKANVTSVSQPTGQPRFSQLTNANGIAALPCLAPGRYSIQVSSSGYETRRTSFFIGNQTVDMLQILVRTSSGLPVVLLVVGGVAAAVVALLTVLFVRARKRNRLARTGGAR
ncbi:PKD domain-containing protein [Candidatus Bathyarchaeota archaeon]|nr:MAG: PKD domain-containing protein [Candidatus Bathyarchaeota archaeon]